MDDGSRSTISEEDQDTSTEWDGSEASFVEDNDAKKFGEEYSGIRLSYKLTKKEIYESIKRAGYYKISKIKSIVETIIVSIALAIFLVSYFIYGNSINIGMTIVCAVVIVAIWLVPHLIVKKQVEIKKSTAKEITVDIYPDEIEVNKGNNGWEIQLDSTSQLEEYDDMFILYLPNTNIFIIPIRAIEPNVLGDIGSFLKAGTMPREKRISRR